MANVSTYKLKNIFGSLKKIGENLSVLFILILLVILVLDGLVVKTSVQSMLDSKAEAPVLKQTQGVKINFADYDAVVKRIQGAKSFTPNINVKANPFGI